MQFPSMCELRNANMPRQFLRYRIQRLLDRMTNCLIRLFASLTHIKYCIIYIPVNLELSDNWQVTLSDNHFNPTGIGIYRIL